MPVAVITNLTPALFTPESLPHWITGGAVVPLLLLLASTAARVRGTTLVAPCIWAMISIVSLGLASLRDDPVTHFAAAVSSLCPLMAVLGAKRPQDRGWQWVVATLWLVLVWPAGQALLSQTDLQLFIAWKLFLVALVALGLLNYLPTRYWLASVLIALGQVVLFSEFLVDIPPIMLPWLQPTAAACFFAAGLSVVWRRRHASAIDPEVSTELARYQHQWRSFRDAYGTFWGLRIMGRVNETARLRNWPMRLTWRGFTLDEKSEPTAEQLAELEQTLAMLLRRFT